MKTINLACWYENSRRYVGVCVGSFMYIAPKGIVMCDNHVCTVVQQRWKKYMAAVASQVQIFHICAFFILISHVFLRFFLFLCNFLAFLQIFAQFWALFHIFCVLNISGSKCLCLFQRFFHFCGPSPAANEPLCKYMTKCQSLHIMTLHCQYIVKTTKY